MDLIVTREVMVGVMRRRMVVMATMLLLSLAGSRVDGAATCSYLPDTSQLSCR